VPQTQRERETSITGLADDRWSVAGHGVVRRVGATEDLILCVGRKVRADKFEIVVASGEDGVGFLGAVWRE
jgi:hypothetical protein